MQALLHLIVAAGIAGGILLAVVTKWSILGVGLIGITISLFVFSLAFISFFIKAVTQSDPADDNTETKTTPTDEDSWYVLVDGKELGPASFDDLAKLAIRGVLPRDVKMRRSGSKHFFVASDISGLFPTSAVSKAEAVPPKI